MWLIQAMDVCNCLAGSGIPSDGTGPFTVRHQERGGM